MEAKINCDKKAFDTLCENLDLKLVLLYGSRATGSPPPSKSSDLDIAVLDRDKDFSYSRYSKIYQKFSQVFNNDELDLVFLNNADPFFRQEIVSRGKLLYGKEEDFLEYRAFAFKDYRDSWDLRQLEERLFQKKFAWIKTKLHAAT